MSITLGLVKLRSDMRRGFAQALSREPCALLRCRDLGRADANRGVTGRITRGTGRLGFGMGRLRGLRFGSRLRLGGAL